MKLNRLFLLTVALPTVLAVVYFGLIASDIYISESRFVVRSPQKQVAAGLGVLLQNVGFSRSLEDTYSVHDFIVSRDALQELNSYLNLAQTFSSHDIDFVNRFASLDWDDSFEALFKYYKKRVTVEIDSTSSISMLRVSAFSPQDAYRINAMLLGMAERLINQLNERARQDLVGYSASEVREAEARAKAASLALAGYRDQKSIFDPEKQSALQLQQISKLQDELIVTKTQLSQVAAFTPDNPQIPALRMRAVSLQGEIDSEMAKVTGGTSSFARKTTEYDRLQLERVFAEKQLASTLASLEAARSEAQRKQLYLERVVQPNKPDIAIEPRRVRSIIVVFVLGLLAWGIVTLLAASVREHMD